MTKKNKLLTLIGLSILLSVLYFFTRIQNLTSIPVFGDEAIYIRWAQIIKSVETLRFIPQTDGKQPFFMWILAAFFGFYTKDPLIAGRLISIFAGFGSLIGIFLVTVTLLNFRQKTNDIFIFIKDSVFNYYSFGLFSALIYVLIPFSFFFDRMALPDNLLSFFGILSLLFSLYNAKFKRLDLALILGAILGLAWLTKSPAIYFIVLSFGTFVFFNFKSVKFYIFPIISSFVSFLIYSVLRLGPQFQMIALRNQDYIWSPLEILKHPLDPLKPHLSDTLTLYHQYISIPILLIGILGIILFFRHLIKQKQFNFSYFIVFCWWILPLIANMAVAKVYTARYILFTLPPFIILLSIGFFYLISNLIKSNPLKIILVLLMFTPNIIFLYKISTKPIDFKLTSTEAGYLQDWTSGWGIKESADYFISRSLDHNVIVGTEGYFGTLPDGLEIYTNNKKQLTVFGVGIDFAQIPEKLIDAKNHGDDVYLLINQSRFKLSSQELDKVKIINRYNKPNNDHLLLIQI